MSKGSTWRIWDFQLHTPASVLNNQFGDPESDGTWETYLERVEAKARETGVVAIGVTDYFTIEGYKKVVDFKNRGGLDQVLVFPNIEFRVDKVIYRTKGGTTPKRLNLHVFFSPEVNTTDIEEGFLHDLDFVYENDPFEPAKTRKLKVTNLAQFGQLLRTQQPEFAARPAFEIGCMNAVVNIDQIKKTLENQFKGRYLIALADEDLSLMDWASQDHGIRKHLLQMSHALLSSNEKTRAFCLGQKHDSCASYIEEFKSLKPCIWGCDSHSYGERFLEPEGKKFCWIKAEVSWEGLKQILYEPQDRVRIQETSPEPSKSIYSIDSIAIASTDIAEGLGVDGLVADLNPNLVAIIGGRGSGKTALLDFIACCFREGKKLEQIEHSFFHRVYGPDKALREPDSAPVNVRIKFRSDDPFAKDVGGDESTFDKADIIYLTQNHFDEYSANPDKLTSHIESLVFSNFADERREYDRIEQEVAEAQRSIESINLEIAQLRSEAFGEKETEQENLRIKSGDKDDCAQRIEEIEAKQGGQDEETRTLTSELETLRTSKQLIENLLEQLNDLRTDVLSFLDRYSGSANAINAQLEALSDLSVVERLPSALTDVSAALEVILRAQRSLDQRSSQTESAIEERRKRVDELEGVNRVIADIQQRLQDASLAITVIEKRIEEIAAKEERIKELQIERLTVFTSMIEKVVSLRTFLQQMIKRFEGDKDKMLQNLNFDAVVEIDGSSYVSALAKKVDNRAHSEAELRELLKDVFERMHQQMNSRETVVDFYSAVTDLVGRVESLKLKGSTSYSDFFNIVLKKFFGISVEIQFNGKHLRELSMGERAIILLKVLLALDDKPLLIDQPEEHLDNRYIFEELTPAIREAKKRRQIIIATHNANLVVNTDAEQIFIAESKSSRLTYRPTTLEDLGTRDEVKTILEGGDEAFKKREEKYGYIF